MAVLKELILTVSTLQGCGSLDLKHFLLDLTVSTLQGCGGLERTDFNSFYFARVWQS